MAIESFCGDPSRRGRYRAEVQNTILYLIVLGIAHLQGEPVTEGTDYELAFPDTYEDYARRVAFSPDDSILVTSGDSLLVWEATTGGLKRSFGVADWRAFTFTPNGRNLITGRGKELLVLEVDSGKTIRRWPLERMEFIAMSPDGFHFATGNSSGVTLWDARHRDGNPTPIPIDRISPKALAFLEKGKTLAIAAFPKTVELWSVSEEPKRVSVYQGHSDSLESIAFDQTSNLVLSADSETIRCWRADTLIDEFTIQAVDLSVVKAGDGGSHIFAIGRKTADEPETILGWNRRSRQAAAVTPPSLTDSVISFAVNSTGTRVAASQSRKLTVFDPDTRHILWTSEEEERRGPRIAFDPYDPNGATILLSPLPDSWERWNLKSGKREPLPFPDTIKVGTLVFSEDRSRVIVGTDDRAVTIADGLLKEFQTARLRHRVQYAGFANGGDSVICSGPLGSLSILSRDGLARRQPPNLWEQKVNERVVFVDEFEEKRRMLIQQALSGQPQGTSPVAPLARAAAADAESHWRGRINRLATSKKGDCFALSAKFTSPSDGNPSGRTEANLAVVLALDSLEPRLILPMSGEEIALSPDGTKVAFAPGENEDALWVLPTGGQGMNADSDGTVLSLTNRTRQAFRILSDSGIANFDQGGFRIVSKNPGSVVDLKWISLTELLVVRYTGMIERWDLEKKGIAASRQGRKGHARITYSDIGGNFILGVDGEDLLYNSDLQLQAIFKFWDDGWLVRDAHGQFDGSPKGVDRVRFRRKGTFEAIQPEEASGLRQTLHVPNLAVLAE